MTRPRRIANFASSQFEHGLAWPLGAAIGVVMIVTVLAALMLPGLLFASTAG